MVEVAEGGLAGVDPKVDRAAAAAVAAVGSAARDVGFLPEGRGPVAAIAGADPDLHAVEEHQGHSRTGRPRTRPGRGRAAGRRRDVGLEVAERVDPLAAVPDGAAPDLEVAVRAGRVAGLADAADVLAPIDVLRRARPRSPTCGCRSCRARSRGRSRPGSRRRCSSSRRRSRCPAAAARDGRAVVGRDVDRVVAVVEVLADVVAATDDRPDEGAARVAGPAGWMLLPPPLFLGPTCSGSAWTAGLGTAIALPLAPGTTSTWPTTRFGSSRPLVARMSVLLTAYCAASASSVSVGLTVTIRPVTGGIRSDLARLDVLLGLEVVGPGDRHHRDVVLGRDGRRACHRP